MKLSVVMAVYNGAHDLAPTLAGILGQTERDFELVVVDDGSTDDTPRILAEAAARDARVRVVAQPNAGLTRALIRGCAEARAPIIARHDCGDRSHPERLARQLACFDDPEVVLAATATRVVGPEGELLYSVRLDGDSIREGLLHADAARIRSLPHHGSAMFRRDAYLAAGCYRPELAVAQDLDLWVRMAAIGKIAIVPEELYEATFHPQSISATARDAQLRATRLIVALRDGGDARALLPQAARIRPRRTRRGEAAGLYFIARCLAAQRHPAARRYLLRSIRRNPWHWRAWAALVTPDLFAVVALAAIVAAISAARQSEILYDDSADYLVSAENLAEGRGFLASASPDAPPAWRFARRPVTWKLDELQGDVEATRTPGYPSFLALMRLAGLTPRGVIWVQHAMHVAWIGAFLIFARRLTRSRGAAIAASLWLIAEPYGRWAAGRIMTEMLFAALLFAAVWIVIDGLMRREVSVARAAVAGILCAAAVLTRPIAVAYFVLAAAFLLVFNRRRRWLAAIVFALCAVVPPLAWSARNARATGIFTLSLIIPIDKLFYRAAGAEAATMPGDFERNLLAVQTRYRTEIEAELALRPMSPSGKLAVVNAKATAALLGHKRGAIRRELADLRTVMLVVLRCDHCGTLRNRAKDLLLLGHTAVLLLAVIGVVALARRDAATAAFLALTIVYFIAIGAGGGGSWGRFRVPIEPYYALFAAAGGAAAVERLRRRAA